MRSGLTNSERLRMLREAHYGGAMIPPVLPGQLWKMIDILSEAAVLLDSTPQMYQKLLGDDHLQKHLRDLRIIQKQIRERAITLKAQTLRGLTK